MRFKIMRWTIAFVAVFSLVGVAGLSQASSLTSQQIQSILGLLQSFGADQSVIENVRSTLNGQSTGPSQSSDSSAVCLHISHNFQMNQTDNTTGGDVSKLQQFLGVNPTGFFGSLTRQAVENWQEMHGIASQGTSGFGAVGPKTRGSMECNQSLSTPQPLQQQSASTGINNASVSDPTSQGFTIPANINVHPGDTAISADGMDKITVNSVTDNPDSVSATISAGALTQGVIFSTNHTTATIGDFTVQYTSRAGEVNIVQVYFSLRRNVQSSVVPSEGNDSVSVHNLLIAAVLQTEQTLSSGNSDLIRPVLIRLYSNGDSALTAQLQSTSTAAILDIARQLVASLPTEQTLRSSTTQWQIQDSKATIFYGSSSGNGSTSGIGINLEKVNGQWQF